MFQRLLLDFILSRGGSVSEYEILVHIAEHMPNFFSDLGDKPSLYKKHFYLFHHLYQMRASQQLDGGVLLISAMKIQLLHQLTSKQELTEMDVLSEFYLDYENLFLSELEVNKMLSNFWQKYLAVDKKTEAIKILGLENINELTKTNVKRKYNQLCNLHHPDKGGDEKKFVEIKDAFNRLYCLL
jgi:DnaJ-like protein